MKKALFTVCFMMLITVVFIASLAWVNESSRQRIAENQRLFTLQSIMYAANQLPEGIIETELAGKTTTADLPWNNRRMLKQAVEGVRSIVLPVLADDRTLLEKSLLTVADSVEVLGIYDENSNLSGYGVTMRGKGLWGTLGAIAVLSPELDRLIGIDFTEQSETPGLGARITEGWFKYFFRGLKVDGLSSGGGLPIVMVGSKAQSNLEKPENSVQSITGATQTCNGVINMLNNDLPFYLRLLQKHQALLDRTME